MYNKRSFSAVITMIDIVAQNRKILIKYTFEGINISKDSSYSR